MGELLTVVETEKAPQAIGPYSQGICAGELLFTAGVRARSTRSTVQVAALPLGAQIEIECVALVDG